MRDLGLEMRENDMVWKEVRGNLKLILYFDGDLVIILPKNFEIIWIWIVKKRGNLTF